MLKNLEIYKDTRKNEKCPCGSGKIFKRCCMTQYREERKLLPASNIVDPFTIFPKLFPEETTLILSTCHMLWTEALLMNGIDKVVTIESDPFLMHEGREIFYANKKEIIDKVLEDEKLETTVIDFIYSMEDAIYGLFMILGMDENCAVFSNANTHYIVHSLNDSFTKLLKDTELPIVVKTALIPYEGRYIFDGTIAIMDELTKSQREKTADIIKKDGLITDMYSEKVFEIPFAITFAVSLDGNKIDAIEDLLTNHISKNFTQGLIQFFYLESFYNVSLVNTMVRTTDFYTKGSQDIADIMMGTIVKAYHSNKNSYQEVIEQDIFSEFFTQSNILKDKQTNGYEEFLQHKNDPKIVHYMTYYSVPGMLFVSEEEYDDMMDVIFDDFKRKEFVDMLNDVVEFLFSSLGIDDIAFPVYAGTKYGKENITDTLYNFGEFETQSQVSLRNVFKGFKQHIDALKKFPLQDES